MQLSYVIPAHNCETTIKKTIQSIIKYSRNLDYEIIAVENGSTDQTNQILKKLSQKISNLKILYSEKGVSNARNLGAKFAKGDWTWFVDADDEVIFDEHKLNMVLHSSADVIVGNYSIDRHKKINVVEKQGLIKDNKLKEFTYCMISSPNKYMTVWNKIFRTNVIKSKQIYFDKNLKVAEDSEFVFQVLKCVKQIYLLDDTIYLYETHSNSTVRSLNTKSINDYVVAMKKMRYYFEPDNNELNVAISKYIYTNFVISMVRGVFSNKKIKVKDKLKIVKRAKNLSVYQDAINNLSFSDMKKMTFIPGIFLKYNLYIIPALMFQLKANINSKREYTE